MPVRVAPAPARSAVRSHTVQTITAMTRSLGTLVGLRRRCPVFDAYAFNRYIACAGLPRGPPQHTTHLPYILDTLHAWAHGTCARAHTATATDVDQRNSNDDPRQQLLATQLAAVVATQLSALTAHAHAPPEQRQRPQRRCKRQARPPYDTLHVS